MYITLPLSEDAQAAIATWDANDRALATSLMLRFAKLHYAINAQKEDPGLETLKQALAQWEDEMLNWYLDLAQDLVPKIQKGYGGAAALSAYHAAFETQPRHEENYRRLRSMFDEFLEA